MPAMGNQIDIPIRHIRQGMRRFLVGDKKTRQKYYICYVQNPMDKNIDIVRIIHTSRLFRKHLNQTTVAEYKGVGTQKK